jgi:hypothetical protein
LKSAEYLLICVRGLRMRVDYVQKLGKIDLAIFFFLIHRYFGFIDYEFLKFLKFVRTVFFESFVVLFELDKSRLEIHRAHDEPELVSRCDRAVRSV